MNKKDITTMIMFTIMLLLLSAASSFAYFLAKITGSETEATIIAGSGSMNINYANGSGIISASNMMPSNTHFANKNFTVTGNNQTGIVMEYNLNLVITTNTFTDLALAYKLTSTNTNSNGTVVPQTTKDMCYLLTGSSTEILGTGSFTGPTGGNKVHTYNLKLYFPETGYRQNADFNKQIEAHIKIEAGIKNQSECKEPISKILLANNGGVSNITEAPTLLFNEINASTENKMYKMEDDYGTSYYFRGAKNYVNNNLIFAGHQWKIIRINGDGSVRLIYNGECPGNSCAINSTGTLTNMKLPSNHALYNSSGNTVYNQTNYNDAKYVGYMYGGANGVASTSRLQATTNETDTRIKSYLDAWYEINIKNTQYESYISDTIFCNDRQLESEVGGWPTGTGFGTSDTDYAAYYRLYTNKTPTLKCGNQNDRFTTTSYNNLSVPGNNSLQYPIGLLTADEASVAGLTDGISNSTNYLYTKQAYWTMSPCLFYGISAYAWVVDSDGIFIGYGVRVVQGVRGVVNLTSSAQVTGTGTNLDPYVVIG